MIRTHLTPPCVVAPTIAHWNREIESTRKTLASGEFPERAKQFHSYIKECRRYIKALRTPITPP